ncbi:MAG TPA: 23S rRNA (guanosine(2251)-2'-O)-methyltransferase RlmB [Steroidobacteraceae bacterium]|nr:23S rRNA (guanosine(2251)-2'-O)-methyltransferase RlmB [Steroidobacteraceae bacterium]
MAEPKRQLIYGLHPVAAVIDTSPERVLELWISRENARVRALRERALAVGLRIQTVPDDALAKLVGEVVHQGTVAAVRPAKPLNEHDLGEAIRASRDPLILVLDGVTDPHNLGACLRTAAAAAASAVVLPKDRSAALDGVARKVASGAAELVPVATVTNLARSLKMMKEQGIWVVGTDAGTDASLYSADLRRPLALVLGAEGSGMRRLTRESCDFLVRIPLCGPMESLNVSVAAGIALFEARRQRLLPGKAPA